MGRPAALIRLPPNSSAALRPGMVNVAPAASPVTEAQRWDHTKAMITKTLPMK